MKDLRFAIRSLAATPIVTCVVVVSLALGLAVVAIVAAWFPAWRASRIDPAEVLRET
jgi:ABC-type lipoprotein release transport system permease subunit